VTAGERQVDRGAGKQFRGASPHDRGLQNASSLVHAVQPEQRVARDDALELDLMGGVVGRNQLIRAEEGGGGAVRDARRGQTAAAGAKDAALHLARQPARLADEAGGEGRGRMVEQVQDGRRL